jgi:hypothetical protein
MIQFYVIVKGGPASRILAPPRLKIIVKDYNKILKKHGAGVIGLLRTGNRSGPVLYLFLDYIGAEIPERATPLCKAA